MIECCLAARAITMRRMLAGWEAQQSCPYAVAILEIAAPIPCDLRQAFGNHFTHEEIQIPSVHSGLIFSF